MSAAVKATPRERPVLMSPAMVMAIMAGTKTQTRRLVTRLAGFGPVTEFGPSTTRGYDWAFRNKRKLWNDISDTRLRECCPYGVPGDRLVFLCAWATERRYDNVKPSKLPKASRIWTLFDGEKPAWCGRSRPGRFMPKRLRALQPKGEVTDIRCQRVHDISEEDARAEGVEPAVFGESWKVLYRDGRCVDVFVEPEPDPEIHAYVHVPSQTFTSARDKFAQLWRQINGPESWAANPYVWCVSFRCLADSERRAA